MKKRLKIVVLAMFVIIYSIANFSLAENEKVSMETTKQDVKSGETFEVTISQESDGIVGFESTLNYDTNVFSLTKKEIGTNWKDMGNNTKLDVIADNAINSGDVFKLTFSVKEGVSAKTSDIKLTGIKLYKTSTDTIDVQDKTLSIKVIGENEGDSENKPVTLSKIEITRAPNTTNYKEGEKFNTTGMIVTASYSDNSTKEVTNYTYSPNSALKTENKLVTISYTENGVTKSTTQTINVTAVQNSNNNNSNQNNRNNTSDNTNQKSNNLTNNTNVTNTPDNTLTSSNLPKTGSAKRYILLIVAGLIGIAFIAYKGYQKYKEI